MLGIVWTANLTRRSRYTPCLNHLFIFYLQVLWNILSCFLLSSCNAFRNATAIRSCTSMCRRGYIPRSVPRNKSVLHDLHCCDVRACLTARGASIAQSPQRLGLTCGGWVNLCLSDGRYGQTGCSEDSWAGNTHEISVTSRHRYLRAALQSEA